MTTQAGQFTSRFRIGTSGWSFLDWVGPFYPPGTTKREMFASYVQAFRTVEVNYTYYRMPAARTLDALARKSPPGFDFWVKANQATTHRQDRNAAGPFIDALAPLISMDKLAGVLLQFPQSFHRTIANRKFLAGTIADFCPVPVAVEFRHRSWQHQQVSDDLAERNVSLVIPDAPDIDLLYHHAPSATNGVGYLRLHSRIAGNWYEGGGDRYDYFYDQQELRELAVQWRELLDRQAEKIYVFFNNCHRGQAAENALAFERILQQIN
ncbi:MAG: DUF72 domain-containing protein [Phycisphaerae bacterium]